MPHASYILLFRSLLSGILVPACLSLVVRMVVVWIQVLAGSSGVWFEIDVNPKMQAVSRYNHYIIMMSLLPLGCTLAP